MRELFQKRRSDFLRLCAKYLRYVFNDHFVLVLMVLLGFLSLQYRQLLQEFPETTWPIFLVCLLISLLILFSGRIATYLEDADQIFLLPKEDAVVDQLRQATKRTFILWSGVQLLAQVLLVPLYLKLGFPIWLIVTYVVFLMVAKALLLKKQAGMYQQQGGLSWLKMVRGEQKRQQAILRFFALFTRVKGVTTTIKPRRYLDGLLGLVSGRRRQTWFYLYLRAFFRAGDYLGLTLRLLLLALVAVVALEESWLAVGLVLLFHYLLLFQLLGLYKHYDYQYITQLYPLDEKEKQAGFQTVLRVILYSLLTVEGLAALLFIGEKVMLLALVFLGIFLHELYLPLKLKKLID